MTEKFGTFLSMLIVDVKETEWDQKKCAEECEKLKNLFINGQFDEIEKYVDDIANTKKKEIKNTLIKIQMEKEILAHLMTLESLVMAKLGVKARQCDEILEMNREQIESKLKQIESIKEE